MRSSPSIPRREVLGTVLLGLVLAVITTWPLVLHLGTHIPGDLVDPLAEAWELSWGGHQLRADPGALWQANVFAPSPDSFAFSDSLLGYLPLSVLGGQGIAATLVRYNLAYVLAYALCFVGATLLARELGASRVAAVVGGVAYAWAPWRAAHDGHLNILTTGGIALAAFLLVRGYRRASAPTIVGGWAAVAWQLTIGFALGIWFAYAVALLGAVVAGRWLLGGRPAVPRSTVVGSAVGLAVLGATLAVLLPPYLRVTDRYPEARRTVADLDFFSPPPEGMLVAPPRNKVWGDATADARETLPWAPEQALLPGLAVLVLATVGVAGGGLRKRTRLAALTSLAVVTVLSFGTRGPAGGRRAYRYLFEHAPGWNALRTPGRLTTFTSLALAVLAALGATSVLRVVTPQGRHRRGGNRPGLRVRRAAVGTALAVVVMVEGLATLPVVEAPLPPDGWPGSRALSVHLPYRFDYDVRYMFWSTQGYPRIVNGNTSFLPPPLADLQQRLRSFPSADSVAALRGLGVASVVVHQRQVAGSEWAGVLARPYDPAALRVEQVGELVVYTVLSAGAGS
jgi:hypothetical protein